VLENWQSEYLQFTLYILATVWLLQRGSPESKKPGEAVASPTRTRRSAPRATPTRRAGRASAAGRAVLLELAAHRDDVDLARSWTGSRSPGDVAYNAEQIDTARRR
jgi:hypothetical protein